MSRIHHLQFCVAVVISLSLLASSSASSFLSDSIFGDHIATGRNLLQVKKRCPVNFEFQNYTIITSQCKGPQYPTQLCCPAFKEFACPFADEINDLTTDCSTTMFSYINKYGGYPDGIFSSICRDDKEGLVCPAPPPSQSADANGSLITCNPSALLLLAMTFVVLQRFF